MEYNTKLSPYIYAGTILTNRDILRIVSDALEIPINEIISKNNSTQITDARLIVLNEIRKRSDNYFTDILKSLNFEVKRSACVQLLSTYEDKYNFDIYFKEKVEKVKKEMIKLNIDYEQSRVI